MQTSRHVAKALIYGNEAKAASDITALMRDRFGCQTVQVTDARKLLDRVYDQMPSVIVALPASPEDPVMTVLRSIKQDAVLEYIPVLLIVPDSHPHEMYGFDEGAIVDLKRNDKLLMAVTLILIDVEHQLDMNPFTGLPGHHTSIEKLQIAVDMGGPHTLCSIRVRGLESFSSHNGALSADTLFRRMIDEIRRCFEAVVGGRGFLGHLGKRTFVTALADADAALFAEGIVKFFDANYEVLEAYATQARFTGAKDPLRDRYAKKKPVTISLAVIPLESRRYRDAAELLRAADAVHEALGPLPGNVKAEPAALSAAASEGSHTDSPPQAGHPAASAAGALVREMLETGRIEIYFQPIVDYWEADIFAYEALARFTAGDGTFVHPLILFEAARAAGLIVELDLACMRAAIARYDTLGLKPKLFLNVNRETFIGLVDAPQIFDRSSAVSGRLVIELTEQSLMGERNRVMAVKSFLDQKGIEIAFDDAGTGEVSFREVGEIRPAFIKFDRQLVSEITRSTLKQRHVLSMRAFARGIGARTIAEGIEMPSEFNYFRTIRLDLAQGYLIAKPASNPDLRIDHRNLMGGG